MERPREWRRRIILFAFFALIIISQSVVVHAVPSWYAGLIQVSPGGSQVPIENNIFNRQDFEFAGARLLMNPWEWDAEEEEWVYVLQPGESWTWVWLDAVTGHFKATYTLTYEGGEDHCWSDGSCGTFSSWWMAMPLVCMPESDRIRVEIWQHNTLLGGDEFSPSRFRPGFAEIVLPGPIEPRRTRGGEGEFSDIDVRVTDDLGCGQAIEGALVTLSSFVEGGTNGQQYFMSGDRGTGRFRSLGYNATLNPDGSHQDDTAIEGQTDAEGVFRVRYQAQAHAAEEIIRFEVRRPATATDPEETGFPIEGELRIEIPGLVQITHDNGHIAFRDGGTCVHDPLPHWLTPNTRSRVIGLAAIYHQATGRLLSLNDGSLPMGGVIARGRVNVEREHSNDGMPRCHGSHRQGIDIDINSVDRLVGEPWNEPPGKNMRETVIEFSGGHATLLRFLDRWAARLDGQAIHSPNSIHYRFPE